MGNRRLAVMLAAAGLGLAALAPLAAQAAQPAAANRGASLVAVSCPAAKFCLAVGGHSARGGRRSLAEEWNGKAWRQLTSAPGRGLSGVSCTSTWFCMVTVGATAKTPESVEIFNGRTWRATTTPPPGSTGISCASRRLCMVLRYGTRETVEKWNGAKWSPFPPLCGPDPPSGCELMALSCANALNCMVTGEGTTDDNGDLAGFSFVWDGTGWSSVQTPYTFGSWTVSCAGTGFCMILPWASYNGSWTIIPACARPHCGLGQVLSCASARFCMTVWAPGHVASIWDGTSLTVTNLAPVTGAGRPDLPGLSCATATSCMTVGSYTKNSQGFTLAELWNGTRWQITKTLSPR